MNKITNEEKLIEAINNCNDAGLEAVRRSIAYFGNADGYCKNRKYEPTLKEKVLSIVNNLNEEGMAEAYSVAKHMPRIEEYNKYTTPERHAELQKEKDLREKKHIEEYEERQKRINKELQERESVYVKNKTMRIIGHQCITQFVNDETRDSINDVMRAYKGESDRSMMRIDMFILGFIHGKRAERNKEPRKVRQAKSKGYLNIG